MNPYISQLNKFFSEHPPNHSESDVYSLLNFLSEQYLIYNPIDLTAASSTLCSIDPILHKLSYKRRRIIMNTFSAVCAQQTKAAFSEGLRVGVQLFNELSETARSEEETE